MTNGVGGACLCGRRAHNLLRASIEWWVAHAEIESARVPGEPQKTIGQGRVAHKAARSWVMVNRMGPVGSARRTLMCSDRPLRSILA
jgi:hypothetical protein